MTDGRTQTAVYNDAPQPNYYTRIPNMAIYELDVYAFKLLAVLMDTSRSSGKCWKANKDLASEVGCSINKMKQARQELTKKGYITYSAGTSTKRAMVVIQHTAIWARNNQVMGVSPDDTPTQKGVSQNDNGVSRDDTLRTEGVSRDDNSTKQEDININKKKNKDQSSSDDVVIPFESPTESSDDDEVKADSKMVTGLITAWCNGNKIPKKKKGQKSDPRSKYYGWYRVEAETLVLDGITPAHVGKFVSELKKESYWEDKVVSWKKVFEEIIEWRNKGKSNQPIKREDLNPALRNLIKPRPCNVPEQVDQVKAS